MDPLEEQLAQLSFLNSRPLSSPYSNNSISTNNASDKMPKTIASKVAVLVSNLQGDNGYIHTGKNLESRAISPKKVGPIVPPKPQKKKQNLPEVPQSSYVRQLCEPLYSQRLQSLELEPSNRGENATLTGSLLVNAPLLQRKQPIYATKNSLYNNTGKVTLDNPAILEQQLEALAHHKKQLEKKGLLQQHEEQKVRDSAGSMCIPKLSSTSFISDLPPNEHASIYSNLLSVPKKPADDPKKSDIVANAYSNNQKGLSSAEGNIYSNVVYGKEVLDDLPPPPPAVLYVATAEASEYLPNVNASEDDVPPPPSPVSSSYSELRRASDVFSKKQDSAKALQQNKAAVGAKDFTNYDDHRIIEVDKTKTADNRLAYINMNYANDYTSCSQTLQGSSAYESIYEPINPRPPSQLSTRSNYLMFSPYVNGAQIMDGSTGGMLSNSNSINLSTLGGISPSGANTPLYPLGVGANGKSSQQEAEVEALTDFLVHSMDSSNDTDNYDNYGVCYKCNERVLGENSGCTAMDQIYHIACFTCTQCQINLQGKPFYALDVKPFCEYDYLQTLEKCSVCMKPILERILRATGKPYHPQCFTCIVCGHSLDGIPFTVDATNQNYCIADFHKKFAPRCCVCKEPIMPEPGEEETVRVVALDRSFHFECYKCEDCGLLLSSEAEGRGCYPLDDHVLCKSCNAKRVQMLTNRMTTEL